MDDLQEAQTVDRNDVPYVEDTAKMAYDRAHMPESTIDIRLSSLESRIEAKMSSMDSEDKILGLELKVDGRVCVNSFFDLFEVVI